MHTNYKLNLLFHFHYLRGIYFFLLNNIWRMKRAIRLVYYAFSVSFACIQDENFWPLSITIRSNYGISKRNNYENMIVFGQLLYFPFEKHVHVLCNLNACRRCYGCFAIQVAN